MTNLFIHFTNVCFSAVLQSATNVTGPWVDVDAQFYACAAAHSFTVGIQTNASLASLPRPKDGINPGGTNNVATNGAAFLNFTRFYRGKIMDNGVKPTPEHVYVFKHDGNSVDVSATLQFLCDDSQATPTEFWRSFNGGSFVQRTNLNSPTFRDSGLAPGTYRYKARITGGWFSDEEPEVILP